MIATTKQEHFISPTALHLGKLCFNGRLLAATQGSAPTLLCGLIHFDVDQTSLFPTNDSPLVAVQAKCQWLWPVLGNHFPAYESIPGMLCIACLGREWQNDPANHANLTLLPPNRSSFFDPNEFGPNSFRKSWTARARVTTSLMVQDTTSCQLLSASYLALGEDPQRQNVSGFCTPTKRHRRCQWQGCRVIEDHLQSKQYFSLLEFVMKSQADILGFTSDKHKSQQRSQNDKTYPPQGFCPSISLKSLQVWTESPGSSVPLIHNASGRFHRRFSAGSLPSIRWNDPLHSPFLDRHNQFFGENHSHRVRIWSRLISENVLRKTLRSCDELQQKICMYQSERIVRQHN